MFFNRSFLVSVALIFQSAVSLGQAPKYLMPDEEFYRCLQFVDPSFYVSADTAELRQALFKQYSMTYLLAQEAVNAGLDTLPHVRKELSLITELIKKRYLAQLISNSKSIEHTTVSKSEIQEFYHRNIHLFKKIGKSSYIKVLYSNEKDEGKARELLLPYLKRLPTSWEDIVKVDNEGIILSSDFDIPLNSQQPYTKWLESAKVGSVIGPIKQDGQFVLLLVIRIEPTAVLPFEEVAEVCEIWARAEKKSKWMSAVEQRAGKEYPVIIK